MSDKNADLIPYEGKKKKTSGSGTKMCKPLQTNDMSAILDMAIDVSTQRMGRPAEYPHTPQGLDKFINKTIDYFEYINTVNANPELETKLIPDVESWSVFLGITRVTLWSYQNRGGEWKDTIEYYKTIITATKKQLAFNYRIPPVVFVFDACNNSGYANTSEFKISENKPEPGKKENIDEQIKAAGLIWNETLGSFEPREE